MSERKCHGGCDRSPVLDWDDSDALYCRACWQDYQESKREEGGEA
jgi:hypothetical protein